MIDSNINTFLSAQVGITSIVSVRIYGVILPAKPIYPAITIRDDDHDNGETFDGNNDFVRSDYFIDAWATTQDGATVLEKAIREVLKNHTGDMGGIDVQRCVIKSIPGMIYEDSVEAYRKTQLFSIWHNEG